MADNILFAGQAQAADVVVRFKREELPVADPKFKQRVDLAWDKLQDEAKNKKALLWDALLYRLDDFHQHSEGLELDVSLVSYRFAKTARTLPDLAELPSTAWPQSIFTCGLIQTSDNFFVFGKRGATVSRNSIDMIGGALSFTETRLTSGTELFQAIGQEIKEETGVMDNDISELFLKAVFFVPESYKYGFLFSVQLTMNATSVKERFDQLSEKEEMSELIFVSGSELKKTLLELGGYKPILAELV